MVNIKRHYIKVTAIELSGRTKDSLVNTVNLFEYHKSRIALGLQRRYIYYHPFFIVKILSTFYIIIFTNFR